MGRWVNLVLVAAMIVGAVLTYDAKHDAEQAAERVQALRAQIQKEKEMIDLLRAEWSVLTQPARLQGLVERYQQELGLRAFDVRQIATIDEIPARPIGTEHLSGRPALSASIANPVR